MRVERSENGGTDLHGVFLYLAQRDGRTVTATAARGTFLATDDPDTILLRLSSGRLVHDAPAYRVPRVLSFTSRTFRSTCRRSSSSAAAATAPRS